MLKIPTSHHWGALKFMSQKGQKMLSKNGFAPASPKPPRAWVQQKKCLCADVVKFGTFPIFSVAQKFKKKSLVPSASGTKPSAPLMPQINSQNVR